MRVTGIRDRAGAAVCRRRWSLRRKRGTTLVEMVLYLSIVAAVMTFSAGLLREEQVRRERVASAAELQQVITASQIYVAANYERLRDRLLNETTTGEPMIAVHSIGDVIGAGFLPQGFAGGSARKSFAETMTYALVLRAVMRNDTGNASLPVAERFPATVDKDNTVATTGSPAAFVETLIDGDPANDEIDLEVLLVTTSDDPCVILPALHGPRIASQAETAAAGYVTGTPAGDGVAPTACAAVKDDPAWEGRFVATGPYGSWSLPLAPYADLTLASGAPAVQAGRLASLLALQRRPPLSESAAMAEAGDSAFRCADVPANTEAELACQQSDLMYSGIRFSAWDSDGNGTPDMQPGLEGVYSISLETPAAGSGAQIRNVLSLSCTDEEGETTPSTAGTLAVDCANTALQGLVVSETATFDSTVKFGSVSVQEVNDSLNVDKGVTVGGAVTAASAELQSAAIAGDLVIGPDGVATNSSAGTSAASGNASIILNGQNIEGRFVNSSVQAFTSNAALTVPKPSCPSTGGYTASIAAFPVSYKARDLREQKIEVSETAGNTAWKVNLVQLVGRSVLLSTTDEVKNPVGAQLFVQTWCAGSGSSPGDDD